LVFCIVAEELRMSAANQSGIIRIFGKLVFCKVRFKDVYRLLYFDCLAIELINRDAFYLTFQGLQQGGIWMRTSDRNNVGV
jgi:hypothetical protein